MRFWTILGEKIGVFLKKKQFNDQNFALFSSGLSQKRQFFRQIFRQKNHNIGPWSTYM
jgi:hypothetical protein